MEHGPTVSFTAHEGLAAGPIEETVTSDLIGETFGLPVDIEDREGRFTARAAVKQQV